MEHFILDTNVFFNLEAKMGLGDNPKEIFLSFSHFAKGFLHSKKAAFYMPPKIVDELYTFIEPDTEYLKSFLSLIHVASPDIPAHQFPASIFYQFVQESRERAYRGMQVAEELIDQTAKDMMGKDLSGIEYQKQVGEHIKRLRDRYRTATRVNFLDSVADLDLIVLTKQLGGTLLSTDEGVLRFGRAFGIKEVMPSQVKERLESLL
ncbi:MAG: RNA ligase partner protein [Candidatus Roizmanbacteria bacterium]